MGTQHTVKSAWDPRHYLDWRTLCIGGHLGDQWLAVIEGRSPFWIPPCTCLYYTDPCTRSSLAGHFLDTHITVLGERGGAVTTISVTDTRAAVMAAIASVPVTLMWGEGLLPMSLSIGGGGGSPRGVICLILVSSDGRPQPSVRPSP